MSTPTSTNTTRRQPTGAYRPAPRAPYTGDGMECVAFLDPSTNAQRLADVAAWHEAPRRSGERHRKIARVLREAAFAAHEADEWKVVE